MVRLPAVCAALVALLAQKSAPPVPLAQRIPLPAGYASEQDTESDGVFDFATARGVRGHILRRFVQPGDDKSNVLEVVAHFAGELHRQGGIVLNDRLNDLAGRIDGRIPGAKPVWLHVDVSDEGGLIDVVMLEERQPVAREIPVEESAVPGTWSSDLPIGDRLAPIFQPYRGWAWHAVADGARVRVFGFARSQACATCPVVTDSMPITLAIFDASLKGAPDIPSRRGAAEASLYQNQIIAGLMSVFEKSSPTNSSVSRATAAVAYARQSP
jgi:hypothetical protein